MARGDLLNIAFDGRTAPTKLLGKAVETARRSGARLPFAANTAYVNTIPVSEEPPHPGDREIEHRIRSVIRWNAAALVLRANKVFELGGHIASFQSAATLTTPDPCISGTRLPKATAAISSSCRGTPRRASTRAPTSRVGSRRSSS